MRTLMWFTLGFSGACGCLCLGWTLPVWLIAVLLVLLPGAVLLGRKWERCRPGAAILLGLLVGSIWVGCFSEFYLEPARRLDGTNQETEIILHSYSRATEYGAVADGRMKLDGKSYQVRPYLKRDPLLGPGDRISGTFRFRYTGRGGLQESDYQ